MAKFLFEYDGAFHTSAQFDENGMTIPQVSLIEMGEAKGHNCSVDSTTLRQVFECAKKMGTMKFKVDHGSGVLATEGWFSNFTLSADKVAADLNFYDSMDPVERKKILEIAKKIPTHLGISLEFEGDDESMANKNFARCETLFTGALVSDPAATKSLFEKKKLAASTDYCMSSADDKKDTTEKTMSDKKKLDDSPDTKPVVKVDGADDQQPPAWAQAMCKKFDDNMAGQAALMKRMDDFEGVPAKDPKDSPATPDADKKDKDGGEGTDGDKDKSLQAKIDKAVADGIAVGMKSFASKLGLRIPAGGGADGGQDGKDTTNGGKKDFQAIVDDKAEELLDSGKAKTPHEAATKAMALCLKSNPKEYAATFRNRFVAPKA
jgi:hypothetical protein